jgi:hypothetical protein
MINNSIQKKTAFFILSVIIIITLFITYKPILIAAGNYLAPQGIDKADAVIVENSEVIREKGLKIGMDLLSSGRSNHLVIVYQNTENNRIFDRPLNYNLLVIRKLEQLGLRKDQIQVIEVPSEHPITLTEARSVLSDLSRSGVKSAIVMAEGFHTRRSYWAYKQIGLSMDIKIIPYPYFIRYRIENWWMHLKGVYDFTHEFLKFLYYVLCNYIPVKSLLVL